jgi:hypothetical protein
MLLSSNDINYSRNKKLGLRNLILYQNNTQNLYILKCCFKACLNSSQGFIPNPPQTLKLNKIKRVLNEILEYYVYFKT